MVPKKPLPVKAETVAPLAVNPMAAALMGPLVDLFTPGVLFALELQLVFPAKLQDLLNRFLDLPIAPPGPNNPESIIGQIKALFEKAREHWNEGRLKEARNAMERLVRYLFNDNVFAPLPPAVAPLRPDDLSSLRREAQFMRDYLRALSPN